MALLLVGAVPLRAQTISFQGQLTNADGFPVADGSYSIRFHLFDQATGGAARWNETHTVTTSGGVFSTRLGIENPLPLDAATTLYLALTIDGEPMEPRTPLTAVPYALTSYRLAEEALVAGQNVSITRRADGALQIGATGGGTGGLTSVATDAPLSGDGTDGNPLQLADGSVAGEKLADDALVAGANVTITRQGGGAFEIAATGGSGSGLTQVASDGTLAGDGTAANPLQLADAAITGAKLADGALVAGQNVTITRQGTGAFEIAATGSGTGLTQVASDATLVGEGTAGSPLAVQVPLVLTNPGNGTVLEAHNGTGTLGHLGRSDAGAYGQHSQGHRGLLGSEYSGVFGLHSNGNTGELGSSNYGAYGFSNTAAGVYGAHTNGTYGLLGSGNHGVYGEHGNGHFGLLGANGLGILGAHSSGNLGTLGSSDYGVYGISSNEAGVYGEHNNGSFGYLGGGYGVYGESSNGSIGILGGGSSGVYASHASNGNWGELGGGTYAASGQNGNGNAGVLGANGFAVGGYSASGDAGYFEGHVAIIGTLAKSGGSFKIDHPLDPANKYLAHSFVESPDMKNVYDGTVVLDANGEAIVELPAYFEALNRDFRYQLTCIGGFAPVYIAEEMTGNTFTIAGGTPGMKVSWQVTGIRQDAWAEEHRIVVEEDKPAEERGFYLHPRLFGQPEERSLTWARDPELMRALQATPVRPHVERPQQEVEQARQEAARVQRERERLRAPEHQ